MFQERSLLSDETNFSYVSFHRKKKKVRNVSFRLEGRENISRSRCSSIRRKVKRNITILVRKCVENNVVFPIAF